MIPDDLALSGIFVLEKNFSKTSRGLHFSTREMSRGVTAQYDVNA
ncbi:MAG TPA: hypothetical protein PKO44_08000 [Candidatus Omnitrophota bacterium]|nr:hypothetical protein [Candidatus Omnitrophota bacterium]